MRRKGFTLVELLVVIAIIALLMGILMPALSRVRAIAIRVVCGSHLSSIGKAVMLYANEYQGKYPRAGGTDSTWGLTTNFAATPTGGETDAFGYPGGATATIGASLFYLIKYADASTKTFLCGGDVGTSEFKLSDYASTPVYNNDITEAWDFGGTGSPPGSSANGTPIPAKHYSYSYHFPYSRIGTSYFPISGTSDAGMAIMADKSPYIVLTPDDTWLIYTYSTGNREIEKWGNSANHNKEGQNVLFNDGHTSFENVSYCGVGSDNIYTMRDISAGAYKEQGIIPPKVRCFNATVYPRAKDDSLLLNEGIDQKP